MTDVKVDVDVLFGSEMQRLTSNKACLPGRVRVVQEGAERKKGRGCEKPGRTSVETRHEKGQGAAAGKKRPSTTERKVRSLFVRSAQRLRWSGVGMRDEEGK